MFSYNIFLYLCVDNVNHTYSFKSNFCPKYEIHSNFKDIDSDIFCDHDQNKEDKFINKYSESKFEHLSKYEYTPYDWNFKIQYDSTNGYYIDLIRIKQHQLYTSKKNIGYIILRDKIIQDNIDSIKQKLETYNIELCDKINDAIYLPKIKFKDLSFLFDKKIHSSTIFIIDDNFLSTYQLYESYFNKYNIDINKIFEINEFITYCASMLLHIFDENIKPLYFNTAEEAQEYVRKLQLRILKAKNQMLNNQLSKSNIENLIIQQKNIKDKLDFINRELNKIAV